MARPEILAFIKKHFPILLIVYLIGLIVVFRLRATYPDSLFWLVVSLLYGSIWYIVGLLLLGDWLIKLARRFLPKSSIKASSNPTELAIKLAQASDPNSTPQQLLALAAEFPKEVLANPVMPLLSLEDPVFYEGLLQKVNENLPVQEIKERCGKLDGTQLRLFAAECAERAVALLEEHLPNEKRPRRMLALARLYSRAIWQHRPFAWETKRSVEAALRFVEGDASEEDVVRCKATVAAYKNLFDSHSKGVIEELRARQPQSNTLVVYLIGKSIGAASAAVCGYAFYASRESEDAVLVAARFAHARLPPQPREEKAQSEKLAHRQWQLDTLARYLAQ